MKLLTLIIIKPKMNEWVKKRYQHLTNPWVIISLLVALFWIWVTWGTLNFRVNKLEQFQQEVNLVELQKTLTAMQKDIEYIRLQMNILNSK